MMLKLMAGFPGDKSGKSHTLVDNIESINVGDYVCHSLEEFDNWIRDLQDHYSPARVLGEINYWREAHTSLDNGARNDPGVVIQAVPSNELYHEKRISYRTFFFMKNGLGHFAINNYPTYILSDNGKTIETHYVNS